MNFLEKTSTIFKGSLFNPSTYLPIPTLLTHLSTQLFSQGASSIETPSSPLSNRRLADLKHVLESKELKAKFSDFLEKFFLQLDPIQLFKLMTEILNKNLSYEETYQELLNRIGEASKGTTGTFFAHLRSAKILKKTLATQIEKLLGRHVVINGYAEIGSPGRLICPLKAQADMTIKGPRLAIGGEKKLSDYLDAGFPLPYDTLIPLNDENPILTDIDKSSLELVISPNGLHHIPPDKVQKFVQSIHDVLKPEGSFILREHDIKNKELESLVHVVQSVFNAATGVPVQAEMDGIRSYRNLSSWIKLLENNGFKYEGGPLVAEGDPTENALLRFTKIPSTPKEAHLHELEKAIRETRKNYERPLEHTYLTTLEWHLAALTEEYAQFIKTQPIYEFSFFKQIQVLGKVFFDSCKDAINSSSFNSVATSEYMLMNLFLFMSTTLGFLLKGLAYAPLAFSKRLTQDPENFDPFTYLVKDGQEHAEFIKKTPSYEFPHFRKMWNLWKGYLKAPKKSFLSTYVTAIATVEYAAKGFISAPLAKLHRDLRKEKIQLIIEDPKDRINSILDERIEVIKTDSKFKLKAIEIPGNLQFKDILRKLIAFNAKIMSIAGQKKIQVKVKILNESDDLLKGLKGCKILSHIPIVTDPSHQYVRVEAEVPELNTIIKSLEASGIEIINLHDF